MPQADYDFLIVGQGLAGSLLACELLSAKQRVLVIDADHQGSASMVAAGIINPITGHRLNITQGFHNYFPTAQRCYEGLEKKFTASFFSLIEQHRLIKNPGQREYYKQRLKEPEYEGLIRPADDNYFADDSHGCLAIGSSAIIDTRALLTAVREYLQTHNSYQNEPIEYHLINWQPTIQVNGKTARRIVFCEGYQAIYNPWLARLPFKLAKGDILTVETDLQEPRLLNWGYWLAPNTRGQSRLGANFVWNDLSLTKTPGIEQTLLNSLAEKTRHTAMLLDHTVGIRPTTLHRQPFVGPIAALPNAYCFNGFGSKGCLIIPYYARLLRSNMLNNTELPTALTQWL